ncbi:MAG: prephenate dehydratase [bacterium]
MKAITKIAIQGGRASFHDMAARAYFADTEIELKACRTFRQQIQDLLAGEVACAVLAIENTLSGSILPNYSLLQNAAVTIAGEVYLHIRQNLMALPGQALADIEWVKSHPIALHQCSEFLEDHPHLRSVETHDTAESAREIREQRETGVAAIAGTLAAELYGLEILAPSIENIKENYTRFLIIARRDGGHQVSPTANKASLSFHVMHKVGALAQILDILRDNGLNLGLIQSTPIPGRPDEYAFHIDVEWLERPDFDEAVRELAPVTRELRILGEYEVGKKPYDNRQS